MVKNKKGNLFLTVLFTVISLLWIFPIIEVVLNSFKRKAYISREPFGLPTGKMFEGAEELYKWNRENRLFSGVRAEPSGYCPFRSGTSSLHFHVRMVYCQSKKRDFFSDVLRICFLHDRAFPDGDVTLSKIANMLKLTTPLDWCWCIWGLEQGSACLCLPDS